MNPSYYEKYFIILVPCDNWECENGGQCIANPGLAPHYAECECPEEYEGEHCELRMFIYTSL